MRLRRRRRGNARGLQLFLRGGQIRHIEERDAEIDARERETRIELQRAPESIGRFFVFELFEQRDAEIVGAIRVFARVWLRSEVSCGWLNTN